MHVANIRHQWQWKDDTDISYLSIFAESIKLMGPEANPPTVSHILDLRHNSALDNAVLNPLYDARALPNTLSGVTRTLPLITGTWRPLPTTGL